MSKGYFYQYIYITRIFIRAPCWISAYAFDKIFIVQIHGRSCLCQVSAFCPCRQSPVSFITPVRRRRWRHRMSQVYLSLQDVVRELMRYQNSLFACSLSWRPPVSVSAHHSRRVCVFIRSLYQAMARVVARYLYNPMHGARACTALPTFVVKGGLQTMQCTSAIRSAATDVMEDHGSFISETSRLSCCFLLHRFQSQIQVCIDRVPRPTAHPDQAISLIWLLQPPPIVVRALY